MSCLLHQTLRYVCKRENNSTHLHAEYYVEGIVRQVFTAFYFILHVRITLSYHMSRPG